ncbi:MAG: hypothetical protein U9O41_01055 [Candidatus Aerophobetes bacterium]|nr:hypothetical protein [Candidatus Aerophobetes bacterium]
MKKNISETQPIPNREDIKIVKSLSGKEVSKYNSWKHGILSDAIVEQERDDFEELHKSLIAEFNPESTIELLLVERIALYQLRLYRAARAEARFIIKPSTFLDFDFSDESSTEDENETKGIRLKYDKVAELNNVYLRYEKTLENRLYRALHELERIQRTRKGDQVPPPLAIDVAMKEK